MILLSLLLLLGSVGLLAAGFVVGSLALVWCSVAASVVAGGAIYWAARLRRGEGVEPPAEVAGPPLSPPGPPAGAPPDETGAGWPGQAPPRQEQAGAPPPEQPARVPPPPLDEPGEEWVAAADAERVATLGDEVLVVDGRPRYHRAVCPHLAGRPTVPLPVSEARRAGFTPCVLCHPDAALLAAHRTGS